jgi:hypothetical protein
MELTKKEITQIKNRFRANQKALAEIRKKLDIIEAENTQLMNLISGLKETSSFEDIEIERIIAKRNARMIKR